MAFNKRKFSSGETLFFTMIAPLAPAQHRRGGGACDSPIVPDKPDTFVNRYYGAILTGGAAAVGAKPPGASDDIINGFLKEQKFFKFPLPYHPGDVAFSCFIHEMKQSKTYPPERVS